MEFISDIEHHLKNSQWKMGSDMMLNVLPMPVSDNLENVFIGWLNIILKGLSEEGLINLSSDLVHLLEVVLSIVATLEESKKSILKVYIPKVYQILSRYMKEMSEERAHYSDAEDSRTISIVLRAFIVCMENASEFQITKPYVDQIEETILKCVDSENRQLLVRASECLCVLNAFSNIANKADDKGSRYIDMITNELNQTLHANLDFVYGENGLNFPNRLKQPKYGVENSSTQNFALFQTRLSNLTFLLANLLGGRGDGAWLNLPLASLFHTIATSINGVERLIAGARDDKSTLELLFERAEAKSEIVAPSILQSMLSILDALLLSCGQSLVPYVTYMITHMYGPIVNFVSDLKVPSGQYTSPQNVAKDFPYYQLSRNLHTSLIRSLLGRSLNTLFQKMGPHLDLDKKICNQIAKLIKAQSKHQTRLHKYTKLSKLNTAPSHSSPCLDLIKTTFLCLNNAYPHNKALLKELLHHLLTHRDQFNRPRDLRMYLECLFSYTISLPCESKELLCQILDCFRLHSSSLNINIGSYAQETLVTLDAIIHPRFTVVPHIGLPQASPYTLNDDAMGDDHAENFKDKISEIAYNAETKESDSEIEIIPTTFVDLGDIESTTKTDIIIQNYASSFAPNEEDIEVEEERRNGPPEQPSHGLFDKKGSPKRANITPLMDISKKLRFDHQNSISIQLPVSEDMQKLIDSFDPQSSSSDSE